MDSRYRGYPVVLWKIGNLCPICRAARRDWWTLWGRPLVLHHRPR